MPREYGSSRRAPLIWIKIIVAAVATVRCGSPMAPAKAAPTFQTFQSPHFAFRHTALDDATIAQTGAAVEGEYGRITVDLAVTQMPQVTVTLYPDVEALRQAVSPIVGAIPTFATGLVTGADAIHILSPSLPANGPYSAAVTNIVHEFAHCVSLRLNPRFGNNPRWLWESVALFEAGQYVDPKSLPYFTSGPLPTLAQLNSLENTVIYSVGATFGRFVVDTRGPEVWLNLIRSNGDIGGVLGLTETAFLQEWSSFVRAAETHQLSAVSYQLSRP
jgi:hypothetical protein